MQKNEQTPKIRILVIEDQKKHQQDAKRFFAAHPEVEIKYRHDFNEVMRDIGFTRRCGSGYYDDSEYRTAPHDPGMDGVISDIYFPPDEFEPEISEASGVVVALICREKGIPCVLNTEGWHHGLKYQWIAHLAKDGLFPIFFASSRKMGKEEAVTKNWEGAFGKLCELIKAKSTESSATESP